MDFANEYYVRLYTRDTTTWKRLLFNGQTVLMHVLRKLDMAGVLDLEDMQPWEAAVLHCGVPEDIARDGMARCLDRGVLVHRGHFLVAPKYREANEACKTDRQRQLESRSRRRTRALEQSVTVGDDASRTVTDGHAYESQNGTAASRSVTKHHERSHGVTLTNSGSGSDAVAASERAVTPSPNGNGSRLQTSTAAATDRESQKLTPTDVAAEWNRVGAPAWSSRPGNTALFQPLSHHERHFEALAVGLNAQADPRGALEAVVAYFWLAPHGPVGSGRITNPKPAVLVEGFTRDLAEALAWKAGVAPATNGSAVNGHRIARAPSPPSDRPELQPFPPMPTIPREPREVPK